MRAKSLSRLRNYRFLELSAAPRAGYRESHGSASMPRQATGIMRRTQEERRQATRAAVLTAALDVLIADGSANFSASRVAVRAGVSRGALERYFPTKNDLLTAATQHAMDAAVAHAEGLAANGGERTVEQFLR